MILKGSETGIMAGECAPRFATPRTKRRSLAPEVTKLARSLGLVLLPWQRRVLAVGLEQSRGRPAYRDVLVSVPRQSGKSSLALALVVWRLLSAPEMNVLYAGQTRAAAREKLLYSWWPRIASSPLADRFELFRGFGAEMVAADNGSRLRLVSATDSGGHGEVCDAVFVDEAWVHQDARLEQALRPTLATRRHGQFWISSTAGTARSTWWRQKLDAGQAAASMGVSDGLACFDWSAPEGANPADEAVWWATMPALGPLIDVETVRTDLQNMGVAEFRRAYLNGWPDPGPEGWRVFSEESWRKARDG
jgi:phage terminase large subunit-like protein